MLVLQVIQGSFNGLEEEYDDVGLRGFARKGKAMYNTYAMLGFALWIIKGTQKSN